MKNFSVLMSIYINEKPQYAEECFQSLLGQTVQASEWVIIEDGPLSNELYELLDRYETNYPGLIKRIPLSENHGLGIALRIGVPECAYELIARMDTDDIARKDRFEKQLKAFENNPDLDICGSNIDEFETSPSEIIARRIVPVEDADIKKYEKRRTAFNHMTVMFKKSAVLQAGNYQDCPYMEDSLLWANMMKNNATCMNLDESLVYVRIGEAMYERRGGLEYFKKYRNGQKKVLDTGYISFFDYSCTVVAQFIIAIMPGKLRALIYKKVLHNSNKRYINNEIIFQ